MGLLDEQRKSNLEGQVRSFAALLRVLGWVSVAGVIVLLMLAMTSNGNGLYLTITALMNAISIPVLFGRASEAEAVAVVEGRTDRLSAQLDTIEAMLTKMSKSAQVEENEEAAQLAALISKVSDVKSSVDDLHEGLSDVMEETLSRISGIKDAVSVKPQERTAPKVEPAPVIYSGPVVVPALDLSNIPESGNK
jgi:hypothetical protein